MHVRDALDAESGSAALSLRELRRELQATADRTLDLLGAEGSGPALVARTLSEAAEGPVILVVTGLEAAHATASDLSFLKRGGLLPEPHHLAVGEASEPLVLTASDAHPYAEVRPDRRVTLSRATTLHWLSAGRPFRFLVVTPSALLRRVAPKAAMAVAGSRVGLGETLDLEALVAKLTHAGYLRVPVVEDPGSVAQRGGLLDVWPGAESDPVRIELDGDLVRSIRSFDPDSQRTLDALSEIWLPPAKDTLAGPEELERARHKLRALCDAVNFPTIKARALVEDVVSGRSFFGHEAYLPAFFPLTSVFEYLPKDATVVLVDPASVVAEFRRELKSARDADLALAEKPHFACEELFLNEAQLAEHLFERPLVLLHRTRVSAGPSGRHGLDRLEACPDETKTLSIRAQHLLTAGPPAGGPRSRGLDSLLQELARWREAGLQTLITARSVTQADRLAVLLSHREVQIARGDDPPSPRDRPRLVVGPLAHGAVATAEGFVLVTEEEIFGQRAHRRATRTRSMRHALEDLRALAPGDYVVHVEHGVGRYLGLETKLIDKLQVDFVAVEYAGGDKLFLPVYRLNQLQKHSGAERPLRLDRLGGQTFAKTKAKVRRRVRELADQLLKLYAERRITKRTPLPPPDAAYRAFEAGFPFEETPDQSAAITDVLSDLRSEKMMDRLVCGDVGFGKTEVALRATFLHAMNGHQVALLCPTTVLAQQHATTLRGRLKDTPIEVRALSRFQSKKEQAATLQRLRDGRVDVVVGTHRLLSRDVHFKSLGLLVIDEEQRFGVTHKERIKNLRTSVDVLTLSATPIPRTLQLALGGLRDLSLIRTPPADRLSIRTVTSRVDPELVQKAIERELSRGGQVFYVYNRVEDIGERAMLVRELVPHARVVVAHGQMSELALERAMLAFVSGDYDVLVSTAIIESGLDIPRANTMIVDRADLFGLSQLYQLRGRIGRASERAYCYLLVPKASEMSETARARVEALERFTELGSGFAVATLDMEHRGTGDLLGAEQSGFVESVGFDLFCQMLEEAGHELSGEAVVHAIDPELSLGVEALLPEDYVPEVGVRLNLYKRLAGAAEESEVDDIGAEIEDRFGPPPIEVRNLVELMRLKTDLRKLRVESCEATQSSVSFRLRADTPLDAELCSALVTARRDLYRLTPEGRLTRRRAADERVSDGLALARKALLELSSCLVPTEPHAVS